MSCLAFTLSRPCISKNLTGLDLASISSCTRIRLKEVHPARWISLRTLLTLPGLQRLSFAFPFRRCRGVRLCSVSLNIRIEQTLPVLRIQVSCSPSFCPHLPSPSFTLLPRLRLFRFPSLDPLQVLTARLHGVRQIVLMIEWDCGLLLSICNLLMRRTSVSSLLENSREGEYPR